MENSCIIPEWVTVALKSQQDVCKMLLADNADLRIKYEQARKKLEMLEALGIKIEGECDAGN